MLLLGISNSHIKTKLFLLVKETTKGKGEQTEVAAPLLRLLEELDLELIPWSSTNDPGLLLWILGHQENQMQLVSPASFC